MRVETSPGLAEQVLLATSDINTGHVWGRGARVGPWGPQDTNHHTALTQLSVCQESSMLRIASNSFMVHHVGLHMAVKTS